MADISIEAVKTGIANEKRISVYTLIWDFDLTFSEAKRMIKALQKSMVIGPAYIDREVDLVFYDLLANNDKVAKSTRAELILFQVKTVFIFSKFLWMTYVLGKKTALERITYVCDREAKEMGLKIKYAIKATQTMREYEVIVVNQVGQERLKQFAYKVKQQLNLKSQGIKITDRGLLITLNLKEVQILQKKNLN